VHTDARRDRIHTPLTGPLDIADSGLAQAFTAWKSSLSNNDAPLRLPGLEHYTPEQLFFISFGRTWETLIRPQTAVVRIRTDPHSPGYWRAVGTLRNLPAFHQAFDCPVGSRVSGRGAREWRGVRFWNHFTHSSHSHTHTPTQLAKNWRGLDCYDDSGQDRADQPGTDEPAQGRAVSALVMIRRRDDSGSDRFPL
jgi:hypothetical protein